MENIGTPILVINQQNQILLGKRKNAYKAGFYGMPGGRVELGEKLTKAVKRELLEETDLEVKSMRYIGVVKENQGSYSFIHLGFCVNEYVGTLENKEPEKCERWEWYSFESLPTEILPGHKAIIEIYLNPNSDRFRDLT